MVEEGLGMDFGPTENWGSERCLGNYKEQTSGDMRHW